MSTYELDDEKVRACLENSTLPQYLAEELEKQLPIPTPDHIGAVVLTEGLHNGGMYVRWAHDNATHSPWIMAGNHEDPYRTDEIGRVTQVLSEGFTG